MKRLVIVALLVALIIPISASAKELDCGELISLGKELGVITYIVQLGNKMGVQVDRYFWLNEFDDVQRIGTLHCILKQHGAKAIMVYDINGNKLGFYVRGSHSYLDLHR